MILEMALFVFVFLELGNVVTMYFKPDFPYANSIAVFRAWGRSQTDERQKLFVTYLVRWVANCKVIFMTLLVLVAVLGSPSLKFWTVVVTMVTIGLYYLALAPLMAKLEALDDIQPQGYSKTLGLTIGAFMALFAVALVAQVVTQGTPW